VDVADSGDAEAFPVAEQTQPNVALPEAQTAKGFRKLEDELAEIERTRIVEALTAGGAAEPEP